MENTEKKDLSSSKGLEAMTKALGIPAIVQLILEHLSRAELLQSRLVDTLWFDLASTILNHRFAKCIYRPLNLAYDEKSKTYKLYVVDTKLIKRAPHENDEDDESEEEEEEGKVVKKVIEEETNQNKNNNNNNNNNNKNKDEDNDNDEKDLTALTNLIKNSNKFPCYAFALFGGHLRNEQLQEFLNTHGKQIRLFYLIKMIVLTEKDEKMHEKQTRKFTKAFIRPLLHMCGHLAGAHACYGDHDSADSDSNSSSSDDENENAGSGGAIDFRWTVDMSLLRNLLWSQLPNLENFSVDPNGVDLPCNAKLFKDDADDEKDQDKDKGQVQKKKKKMMLPRLQNIALINHIPGFWTEVLKEIIMAAPNLNGLNDSIKLVGLSWFKSVNRLNLVQNVRLLIHPMERHINGLTEVADLDLKLKKLELYDVSLLSRFSCDKAALVVKNLEKILESSKDTLEILSVNRPTALQIIPGSFKWPEGGLKKLKLLRLASYSKKEQNRKEHLEYDLNLSTIFPNLTTVFIEGKSGKIFSSVLNQSATVLDKVTRLDIINGSQTRELMEEMVQVFPNIKILTMSNINRFIAFGSSLWKFKELNTLALKLGVDGRSMKDRKQNKGANTNHFPNLDIIFTGFTKETVEKLDKEKEINLDEAQLDELRVNRSILNCEQLRKLDIQFDDVIDNFEHHRLKTAPTFNLFSKVTAFCAFNLMPNLNVTLSIKKNRFVEGNPFANDWKDTGSSSDDDDDDEPDEDVGDEQLSAESDFEYDPMDLDVEAAHKFSHDICLKNVEEALAPMIGFPNVHVVSDMDHDVSIFPDE